MGNRLDDRAKKTYQEGAHHNFLHEGIAKLLAEKKAAQQSQVAPQGKEKPIPECKGKTHKDHETPKGHNLHKDHKTQKDEYRPCEKPFFKDGFFDLFKITEQLTRKARFL